MKNCSIKDFHYGFWWTCHVPIAAHCELDSIGLKVQSCKGWPISIPSSDRNGTSGIKPEQGQKAWMSCMCCVWAHCTRRQMNNVWDLRWIPNKHFFKSPRVSTLWTQHSITIFWAEQRESLFQTTDPGTDRSGVIKGRWKVIYYLDFTKTESTLKQAKLFNRVQN
jgi:hypothetical protein